MREDDVQENDDADDEVKDGVKEDEDENDNADDEVEDEKVEDEVVEKEEEEDYVFSVRCLPVHIGQVRPC